GTKVSFISPYVFSVQVPQDGSGNTLLYTENDAYAAATLPQGSASAVPEPSTLTMACTALLAGIGCWWRRMRRGTAPVAPSARPGRARRRCREPIRNRRGVIPLTGRRKARQDAAADLRR